MKNVQFAVSAALLAATGVAQAELSANIGVSSNYYFRGVTQTDDAAAVSGGLDWGHESGFYLGTWMSNVDFGGKEDVEVDFYGGFSDEANVGSGLGYDVGALWYHYPNGGTIDYAEAYGNLSYWYLSGGVAYTFWGETDDGAFDNGDVYYNASLDLPLPETLGEGLGVSLFGGHYDFDDADSYGQWGVGVRKDAGELGGVSVAYEQADGER